MGARWVQQAVLDKYPRLDLRLYAIWFRMYGMDRRGAWPSDVLTDRRVIHRWDESKAVGLWFSKRLASISDRVASGAIGLERPLPVLWDAYLIYSPDARWATSQAGLLRWGRTILQTRDTFLEEIDALARP